MFSYLRQKNLLNLLSSIFPLIFGWYSIDIYSSTKINHDFLVGTFLILQQCSIERHVKMSEIKFLLHLFTPWVNPWVITMCQVVSTVSKIRKKKSELTSTYLQTHI